MIEWADLAALMPACEPHDPGTELDFAAYCVRGACVGDTLEEVEAVWGPATACDDEQCEWNTGVDVEFDGDPAEGAIVDEFDITSASVGYDENGLGVGATGPCFADALGPPTRVGMERFESSYTFWWLGWDSPELDVFNHDEDWTADFIILH